MVYSTSIGAIGWGQIEVAIYLIEQCKVDPNLKNQNGNTALHHAIGCGQREVVIYLIEQCKMDLNALNNNGYTILHIAALSKNISLVKPLLYYGADLSIKNKAGEYPYEINQDPEILKLIKPSNPDEFKQDPKHTKNNIQKNFIQLLDIPKSLKNLR